MEANTVFQRLVNGEAISPEDPDAFKMREASYHTKKLLLQMNNTSEPAKVRKFLSQITNSEIDESVVVLKFYKDSVKFRLIQNEKIARAT
jgi:hypothetical protein